MTFDPTKPVQTRDGRKARILTTERNLVANIVVLLDDGELYAVNSRGYYGSHTEEEHPMDLVNIPAKRKVWVNVHSYRSLTSVAGPYDTREEADKAAARYDTRVACVEIEWEEV